MVELLTDPKARYGLLTALMAVVLAGAVGAAAWVVYERSEPVRAGAELLEHIRREGLAKYLDDGNMRCFIMQNAVGRPAGWSCETLRKSADGFAGVNTTVSYRSDGESYAVEETWILNADATAGEYRSEEQGKLNTRITLNKGVVSVTHVEGENPVSASTPAPDNYVPEGLLPWVIRQAASGSKIVALGMLMDDESVVSGQVRFTPLTLKPLGAGQMQYEHQGLTFHAKKIYHFDKSGKVAKIETFFPGRSGKDILVTMVACEPQKLLQLFPDDETLQEKLRRLTLESTPAKKKRFLDRWRF